MKTFKKQQGFALFLIVILLATAAATVTVKALKHRSGNIQISRDRITADALAQAKDALIGDAASQSPVDSVGDLRLPDLGFVGATLTEGLTSAPPNFDDNDKNHSVIGKVPWKTLGTAPLRDGQGECLWYVISGRFKNYPKTDTLNWDTQGQIDIIDSNGNPIASNVAALLVAPAGSLPGQNRALSNPVYTQCGGNYDARNYLDSYFTGSTNHRVAPNSDNKQFVMANNNRFLFVTVDDIFRPVIQRIDFKTQIYNLLNDATFKTYLMNFSIVGPKGTAKIDGSNAIDCGRASTDNQNFCKNWWEMLLLTNLPSSASIIIDGMATSICSRVLIFGGQKTGTQVRLTATDKNNPANYLEGGNLSGFATPTASHNSFNGVSTFSSSNPSADLLSCIQ